MSQTQTAEVVNNGTDGNGQEKWWEIKEEEMRQLIVEVGEYTGVPTLVPEAVISMVVGPKEERTVCLFCGGKKDPEKWICRTCFSDCGPQRIRFAQNLVEACTGVVAQLPKPIFHEIVEVMGDTEDELAKTGEEYKDYEIVQGVRAAHPARYANVVDRAMFAALVTSRKRKQKDAEHARQWKLACQLAEEAAARWEGKIGNVQVVVDEIMETRKPECSQGKLYKAVCNVRNRQRKADQVTARIATIAQIAGDVREDLPGTGKNAGKKSRKAYGQKGGKSRRYRHR